MPSNYVPENEDEILPMRARVPPQYMVSYLQSLAREAPMSVASGRRVVVSFMVEVAGVREIGQRTATAEWMEYSKYTCRQLGMKCYMLLRRYES